MDKELELDEPLMPPMGILRLNAIFHRQFMKRRIRLLKDLGSPFLRAVLDDTYGPGSADYAYEVVKNTGTITPEDREDIGATRKITVRNGKYASL